MSFQRNHNKGDVSLVCRARDTLNSIQTTPLHLVRVCVCVIAKTRLEAFLDLAHVRRN